MEAVELTTSAGNAVAGGEGAIPVIPFRMAVLANGLTLIVHEDRRHPLVCTQLRFNVGSKDEPAGRTGFAHLFEHLMFKESTHRRGNWHKMLQAMGGIGVNGTTSLDRTNYFQTVPAAALDRLLWMESDRMGHLLGGIDAATLADEIQVVKNEKRQREGAPYGGVFEAIATTLYPRDHPYGHTVLGSFEDLDNANLETVADWHARWYGASNAVLVLAGDIAFDDALAKVEHWFGAMPAGMPVRRVSQWMPDVRDTRYVTLFDRVPHRRHYSIWSTPPAHSIDSSLLRIVGQILADGAHSRLVRRLVDHDRLCLWIGASQNERSLCSEFQIAATLAPGVEQAPVEAAIMEELQCFIAEGPTQAELDRVRSTERANLLRMLDSIGHVTEVLAANMFLHGRPDGHLAHVEAAERATTDDIRAVAQRWLGRRALVLDVRPFEAATASADPADRVLTPAIGAIHARALPAVERATLDNGLAIQLARCPGTHCVNFALHLDNGAQLDPVGAEGVSRMTLGLLESGTLRHSKQGIGEILAESGFQFSMKLDRGFATLSLDVLKGRLGPAMALVAELLLEPVFPETEFDLLKRRLSADLSGQALSPGGAAGMAIGRLIMGPERGRPIGGGVQSVGAMTRDQIVARHRAWLDPSRATLVIAGDIGLDEVVALAESAFGGWAGGRMDLDPAEPEWRPSPGRYLVERSGGAQSALRIAMASPQIAIGNEALTIFNSLFGGAFGSRLNSNLRERRGWTYGANSGFSVGARPGSFMIQTDVQADRTLDALAEIENELTALSTSRPVTTDEIEEARNGLLVGLPGRWASNGAVLGALLERLSFDLPDDYHDGIEGRIRGVTPRDIEEVVSFVGDPAQYSWVVGGDSLHASDPGLIRIDAEARRLVPGNGID